MYGESDRNLSDWQITKASLAELERSDDEPRTSASDPYILPKGIPPFSSSTERDFVDQLIALVAMKC